MCRGCSIKGYNSYKRGTRMYYSIKNFGWRKGLWFIADVHWLKLTVWIRDHITDRGYEARWQENWNKTLENRK